MVWLNKQLFEHNIHHHTQLQLGKLEDILLTQLLVPTQDLSTEDPSLIKLYTSANSPDNSSLHPNEYTSSKSS